MMRRVTAMAVGVVFSIASFPFSPGVSADSSGVLIYRAQLGGAVSGTTKHEFVELYNNTATDIDVTDWCLIYNNGSTPMVCVEAPDIQTKVYLTAGTTILLMAQEFESYIQTSVPEFEADIIFSASTNLATTNGSLKLVDSNNSVVDKLGWGTGEAETTATPGNVPAGKILQRKASSPSSLIDTDNNLSDFEVVNSPASLIGGGLYELVVPVDVCPNTVEFDLAIPVGYMQDEDGDCYEDVCDNMSELQKTVPIGYKPVGIDCEIIPLNISEILPNASGSDTGNEFIELFNPNDEEVDLTDYYLTLGADAKHYNLPDGMVIQPMLYAMLSDTQLGLTLPNSTSWLSLFAPDGTELDQTDAYTNPGENSSWALVDGAWQFTNQPTPSTVNLTSLEVSETEDGLKPCPEGKFRNPATNRCKNIVDTLADLLPCDPGEQRNPETNRCRKIAALGSTLKACAPDQERNPETNRCRKVAGAASQLKPCEPGFERNPKTTRCRKTAVPLAAANFADATGPQDLDSDFLLIIALFALGYGIYEYRLDAANWLAKLKSK